MAAQRAPLEAWIDKAAQELLPFVILGDFNRRFDRFGQDDHFWRDIDDGDPPPGLNLRRLPFGREAECNPVYRSDRLPGVRRAQVELPPVETRELGVQFQGPLFGGGELWQVGDYAFELLGWAYGRPPGEKANLITEFQATLSAPDVAWLRHWHTIEKQRVDDPGITDRAVGIPFPMHDIKLAR